MAVIAVYLNVESVEDDINLMIYNIKDTSIEGLKKFITSFYSGVDKNDIQFHCFSDGAVDCATFTSKEEEFEEELHWNLEVQSVVNLQQITLHRHPL